MKRCPECRRDYLDETLNFCLDDGTPLVDGPASMDEPETEMMSAGGFGAATPAVSFEAVQKSIAVLPFAHLSSDPDDEYFCDGLAEELLNALARIDGLKVAARTSSFSFKGKNINIGEIGRELGVASVLEGSVRKSGDRLRITVQLISAADGYHIWSDRFDREMRDIFEVQDEITLAVVSALKLKLFGEERSAVLKKGTTSAEAHELYLRGRALWNRRTFDDFNKAIEYFEGAIDLDPGYALAYSGLADCYTFLAYYEAASPAELRPRAKTAVDRAIELDASLPETYSSLAMYKTFFEFDMRAADLELRKAVSINPNSSAAHYWLSATLSVIGRFEESLIEGRIALKLDPLSPIVNSSLARSLCCAGEYEEAIELSNKNFEILPDFFFSHWVLGWAYGQTGRLEESIDHFRKAAKTGGFLIYGHLGNALVKGGFADEARRLLAELEEHSKHRFVSPVPSAIIHAALGDVSEGLRLLEQAYEMRIISLIWMKVDPVFDMFRTEPRFQEVYRRMDLPE